jgi:hypothetical protein
MEDVSNYSLLNLNMVLVLNWWFCYYWATQPDQWWETTQQPHHYPVLIETENTSTERLQEIKTSNQQLFLRCTNPKAEKQ